MVKVLHSIISLLDERHSNLVKKIWGEIERRFGIQSLYTPPIPHFSYQVAEDYDLELLESILRESAKKIKEFRIKTTGLGIFTGEQPVIYIPIIRSPKLLQLHKILWRETQLTGRGIMDLYEPERWMPHITLAQRGLNNYNLPRILRLLSRYDLNWEITVGSISFIYDTGEKQELRFNFEFSGVL